MARRRRSRTHDDDLSSKQDAERAESSSDRAGPQRTDSPQAGVARLAEVAGNQAVAGMLQRDDDEEQDDGGGGPREPIVEQEEAPPAPTPQQGGGQDDFVIGDNVDGGAGERPAQLDAEVQNREERAAGGAELQADAGGGGGGGGSAFGIQLLSLTVANLGGASKSTQKLGRGLANAVAAAWDTWQRAAGVAGVTVNAVTAAGGALTGPDLGPLVASNAAAVDREAGQALGRAIGEAHKSFVSAFGVPGLPSFPTFAAVPAPVAAPTPGVPFPVVAAGLSAAPFNAVGSGLAIKDPEKLQAAAAVADALVGAVTIWVSTTMISLLGQGPVPTFAPPYVPVGPVLGGNAIGFPGSIR